jgi:pimeloyl-ACP methyl ester carboxylesterase
MRTLIMRAAFEEYELEYEARGEGEQIVFVHHGAGADWFAPFLREPVLNTQFRLLRYHRVGYGGSSRLTAPLTFAFEANTFRSLSRQLGIRRAHVVGHSASGCIALQIAADAPEIVHSLVLLEPALMVVPSPPGVLQAIELYRNGRTSEAVDIFLEATCGTNAAAILADTVPDAIQQAVTDADTFFGQELPALRQWRFGQNEATGIKQPVLSVVGEKSDERFHQRHRLLLEWLPHVEPFVLSGGGHLLHLEKPRELAQGMADFFRRHPIDVAA